MVLQAEQHLSTFSEQQKPAQIEVLNANTREVIGAVPIRSAEEVKAAVARSREAQKVWGAMPIKERVKYMRRFIDLLLKKKNMLAKLIHDENGKGYGAALAEVLITANHAEYYCKHAPKWLAPEKRAGAAYFLYSAKVYHHPIGVVGNISPWNFPMLLFTVDMMPALIAGNTVVLKPSEITPLTALETEKIFQEAGFPENVFQVVTGYGDTGASLIDEVDYLMFTGSTATGRKVAARAAQRLIPYSLELGGNDAMIVLKDADLKKAASWAVAGGFENTGQVCVSIERVIVEEAVYDKFLDLLKKYSAKFVLGKAHNMKVYAGGLTNERELERTENHLQDALSKGARLITGGKRLPELGELFYAPTIIADVEAGMEVMHEETFGPIIAVCKAKDPDDAVRIANDTRYGLSASIWSRDTKKAGELALKIESGDVIINAAMIGIATPTIDLEGRKDSGVGKRNGKDGLLKYTHSQSVIVERFPQFLNPPSLYSTRNLLMLRIGRWLNRRFPFLMP